MFAYGKGSSSTSVATASGGGSGGGGSGNDAPLPFGLTEDRISTELFTAWQKDTGEGASPDAFKTYSFMMERALANGRSQSREANFGNTHIGPCFAISLCGLIARSNISKLSLNDNNIGDAGAEAVSQLIKETPQLYHLNLAGNNIGPRGIISLANAISAHHKLQTLILGGDDGSGGGGGHQSSSGKSGSSSGGQSGAAAAATKHKGHRNYMDAVSGKALMDACASSLTKSLKVIDFGYNLLRCSAVYGSNNTYYYTNPTDFSAMPGSDPMVSLEHLLKVVPGLQAVRLAHVGMPVETLVRLIKVLQKSLALNELDLKGNELNQVAAQAIGNYLVARGTQKTVEATLQILNVDDNPHLLRGRGLEALRRGLSVDRKLSTISLNRCGVTDQDLYVLCQSLTNIPSLAQLYLSGNEITVDGTIELCKALVTHSGIQTLTMNQNKLRDDGLCAVASMIRHNKSLEHFEADDAWVGDRGAVALGVALATNKTMVSVSLNRNHISEEGSTAFIALLEKNFWIRQCSLKGNAMHYTTDLKRTKVLNRNRREKEDEVASKLRGEMVQLHYQLYKLSEARADLQFHREKKFEIEEMYQKLELASTEEEMTFVRCKKESEDALVEQESQVTLIAGQLKELEEEMAKCREEHKQDTTHLEYQLEVEVEERKKAEKELEGVTQELDEQTALFDATKDGLRQSITAADDDRQKWEMQREDYNTAMEETRKRLAELQDQVNQQEAAANARRADKANKAAAGEGKATDDIAQLLAAAA